MKKILKYAGHQFMLNLKLDINKGTIKSRAREHQLTINDLGQSNYLKIYIIRDQYLEDDINQAIVLTYDYVNQKDPEATTRKILLDMGFE